MRLSSEQEFCCRKQTRLHKCIKEQLRLSSMLSPESAFGGPRSTSDLSELLQAFRSSIPSDHILTKGTHFTHIKKFTFTQVSSTSLATCTLLKTNASTLRVLMPLICAHQEAVPVTSSIVAGNRSESDTQLHQQEELTLLQQQFQQLCSHFNQLTADMKHKTVSNTQVTSVLTHTCNKTKC